LTNIKFNKVNGIESKRLEAFHFSFRNEFGKTFAQLQDSEYSLFHFSGDVNGYIPVIIKDAKIIKTLKFLFNPVNDLGQSFSAEIESQILDEFISFLKTEGIADRIMQPLNWVLFQSSPINAIKVPFGSYRIDLTVGEEEVWKGLHTKHRNVIRNAEKKGGTIKVGSDQLDVFYELYEATMGRSNMYCEPKSFFEELNSTCNENIYLAVVYHGDMPIGAVCVPYTSYGAFYVYGASADRITLTGAINFLHFEMIKFLISKEVKMYDFVGARLSNISGTKFEGIQKFKARFGGELQEGELWKMDLNAVKCKVYDSALKMKLKLKGIKSGGDIIDQEILKING
jgi:Acetyltransferase (GNAT) domain